MCSKAEAQMKNSMKCVRLWVLSLCGSQVPLKIQRKLQITSLENMHYHVWTDSALRGPTLPSILQVTDKIWPDHSQVSGVRPCISPPALPPLQAGGEGNRPNTDTGPLP